MEQHGHSAENRLKTYKAVHPSDYIITMIEHTRHIKRQSSELYATEKALHRQMKAKPASIDEELKR